MLTRKDYIKIAEIVSSVPLTVRKAQYINREQMVDALADYMAADNPRFDRDRFIRACYGEK